VSFLPLPSFICRGRRNVRPVEKTERRQQIHLRLVVVGNRARVSKAGLTEGILCLQHVQEKTRPDLKVLSGDPQSILCGRLLFLGYGDKSREGITVLGGDDHLLLDLLEEPLCIENGDLSDGT
jgi:hypothetical protein